MTIPRGTCLAFLYNPDMQILTFVRQTLGHDDSGHDEAHVLRVLELARTIQGKEGGDLPYIEGCALLHDCLDSKLGLDNASQEEAVYECLTQNGYSAEKARRMIVTMRRMSFHLHDEEALTIEDKVVRDADRLDAMGRVGAKRALDYGKSRNRPVISPDNRIEIEMGLIPSGESTVAHFYEKLLILDHHLYTDTAKAMAVPLKEELILCLKELYAEEGLVLDEDTLPR